MTEKIYLDTSKKCPGLVCFPLLINVNIQRETKKRFQHAQYNKDITVIIPCIFIFLCSVKWFYQRYKMWK